MPVPKELTGTYVQIARKLRWTKDEPPREDTVSERPTKRGRNAHGSYYIFLDEDEPTLVTFEADDAVNVEGLLKQDAIRPYTPPKKKDEKPPADSSTKRKRKKAADGENG